jgi:hypothetical protein
MFLWMMLLFCSHVTVLVGTYVFCIGIVFIAVSAAIFAASVIIIVVVAVAIVAVAIVAVGVVAAIGVVVCVVGIGVVVFIVLISYFRCCFPLTGLFEAQESQS